jgi:type IV secretory pathway TrbD component
VSTGPTVTEDALARHRLPQSTLFTPRFLGVEAPILAAEIGVLVVVANLSQLRLLTCLVALVAVGALHSMLAAATRKDRRLSLVFARSVRYPRYTRPVAEQRSRRRPAEPTFPKRVLT